MAARRVSHAGLGVMVDRIGSRKAAKRFGVTERTLRGWVKKGVPQRRVREVRGAVERSERAKRASMVANAYRGLGWKKFKNFSEVDLYLGARPGHTMERWFHRKEWWEEHRPEERLPDKVAMVRDKEGRLLYVNGDQVVWRGYTVDGKLFWTHAQNLEGYDTPEQMKEIYESLLGHSVTLFF